MLRTLMAAGVLLAAAPAFAQTTGSPAPLEVGQTLLNVTAEGKVQRTPDIAMFSAGVVTQAPSAGAAVSANSARMNQVIEALRSRGVTERDIQTSALSLQPQYSNPERDNAARVRLDPATPRPEPEPPRIIGYEARNTVQVRVRDLANMGAIIDALVAAGANQVDGPNFTLDQPEAALDEARAQAMQRAMQRAELYARVAGLRVSHIVAINENIGYYPVESIRVTGQSAGYGGPAPPPPPAPVSPGELSLGVNLSVQFALER